MAGNALGSLFVELGVNSAKFVEGLDKASSKARQAGKEIGEAFEGLGDDLGGILSQFGELGDVAGDALSNVGQTIASVTDALGEVSGLSGAIALSLGGVAAVATATAGALVKLATAGAELVDHLSIVSAQTGISANDLETLQAAGATVGVSLDDMVAGFRKFDQAITNTGGRANEGRAVLQSLGITATDNKEALLEVADAFSSMANGAQKDSDAVALFGRSGLNLIPFLNKGRDGLREMDEIVDEYGAKIGSDAVEANDNFAISQQKISLAFDSMKVDAEEKVLPALSSIISTMADVVKQAHDMADALSHIPHPNFSAIGAASGEVAAQPLLPLQLMHEVGAYTNTPTPTQKELTGNAEELASSTASRAQSEALAAAQDAVDAANSQTAAGLKLLEIKRQIAALDSSTVPEDKEKEAALANQIPLLERAAELEKQQIDFKLNPKTPLPQKDVVQDELAKLGEMVGVQNSLADAIGETASAEEIYATAANIKSDIDQKQIATAEELVRVNAQLAQAQEQMRHLGVPEADTDETRQLKAQRDALQKEMSERGADTSQTIELNQRIKTSQMITASGAKITEGNEGIEQQVQPLQRLTEAYNSGNGDQIRSAQAADEVKQYSKALDDAKEALSAYKALNGDTGPVVDELSAAVDRVSTAFQNAKAAQQEFDAAKLTLAIAEQANALKAESASWDILAEAATRGEQAQIAAAGAAAAEKVTTQGGTQAEADQGASDALTKAQQSYAMKVKEKEAQLDLNQSYADEISLLAKVDEDARSSGNPDAGVIHTEALSEALSIQEQITEQWDEAALKVGSIDEKLGAMFDELAEQGQTFWQRFITDGLKTVDTLESGLSKLMFAGLEHGPHAFPDVVNAKKALTGDVIGLGENELTNITKTGVGSAAKGLEEIPGFGGFLQKSGLGKDLGLSGTTKADGSSEGSPLWVRIAGASPASGGKSNADIFQSVFGKDNAPGGTPGFLGGPLGLDKLFSSFGVNTTSTNPLASLNPDAGSTSSTGDSEFSEFLNNAANASSTAASDSGNGGSGGSPWASLLKDGSMFAKIFSFLPHLATGGDVSPGQSYVVGEDHPEIFTPSTPGHIFPDADKMGTKATNAGGASPINIHVHGVTNADSFMQSSSQIAAGMQRAAAVAHQRNR